MPNPIPAPVPLGPLEEAISALVALQPIREELAALEATAATKAALAAVEATAAAGRDALAAAIADLDESKATQAALDALASETADGLAALTATVATKAAQADHLALAARVTDVERNKADDADLSALAGVVATKAAQTDLTALAGRVTTAEGGIASLAARVSDVETGKADASAVTALAGRVTTLETGATALAGRVTAVETGKAAAADLSLMGARLDAIWAFIQQGNPFVLPLRTSLVGSDGRVASFTRPSKAWYEDASGVIREVAEGQPRLRADRGVLIEEARTNRLLWSRDWTQAPWLKNQAIVTRCVGHDGIADTGSRIAFDGIGTVIQEVSGLASAARVGCLSVRRESGEGVVEITLDGATWTQVEPTSTWQRFPVLRAEATGFAFGVRGSGTIDVDFGDVSEGSFALSPVATEGTPLARAADVLSVSTTGWPVGAGRVACRGQTHGAAGSIRRIVSARPGGSNNGWALLVTNVTGFVCGDGAAERSATAALVEDGKSHRYGAAWGSGVGRASFDDVFGETASVPIPNGLPANAYIGSLAGVNAFNGWLSDLEVSSV
jgi:hypothetical protein